MDDHDVFTLECEPDEESISKVTQQRFTKAFLKYCQGRVDGKASPLFSVATPAFIDEPRFDSNTLKYPCTSWAQAILLHQFFHLSFDRYVLDFAPLLTKAYAEAQTAAAEAAQAAEKADNLCTRISEEYEEYAETYAEAEGRATAAKAEAEIAKAEIAKAKAETDNLAAAAKDAAEAAAAAEQRAKSAEDRAERCEAAALSFRHDIRTKHTYT